MNNSDVTEPREKLQDKLRELFQFESSDLDFGIYRILNHRRDEIEQFIEEGLLDAVEDAIGQMRQHRTENIDEHLEAAKAEVFEHLSEDVLDEYGEVVDDKYREFNVVQKYLDILEKKKSTEVAEVTEARIYSDLLKFFSRYYDKGDFCTQRRYSSRDHKYMVPYDGEEVMLHWANKDQYYVKTGERFTNYDFTTGNQSISFKLIAADTPEDNNKSKGRYFIVPGTGCINYHPENNQLTIEFVYRQLTEDEQNEYLDQYEEVTNDSRKTIDRKVVNVVTEAQILEALKAPSIKGRLVENHPDSSDDHTRLGHHLNRYTAANTHDYFVHKDLGGFLHEQLDFFIKNEVLNVDNFLTGEDSDGAYERALLRAKAIREIGRDVIDFLAQIEDFQKRLFEKKKFVVETNWCITLDQVPEDLYPLILDNLDQLNRWFDVYAIDKWEHGPNSPDEINEEFLEEHPSIMVDTGFFRASFATELLSRISNLDAVTDGLLIHSESYQSMQLLEKRLKKPVGFTYLDPPYNTGEDGFVYKDSYQHSSWLSMFGEILAASSTITDSGSSYAISIDETESARLQLQAQDFLNLELLTTFVWEKRRSRENRKAFSVNHDFVHLFTDNRSLFEERMNQLPISDELRERYSNPDDDPRGPWQSVSATAQAGHATEEQFYKFETPAGRIVEPPDGRCWIYTKEKLQKEVEKGRIWFGTDGTGVPRIKTYLKNATGMTPHTLWTSNESGTNDSAKKRLLNLFSSVPDLSHFTPKPNKLLKRLIKICSDETDTVLDYFAGSGTTGHAVINLNQEQNSDRKYILVEMGDYFDTVMIPRIQKVVFANEWKDGVPQFDKNEKLNGATPHIFKYQRLESYEDTLNNIELNRPNVDQEKLPDDYMLSYMLDVESRNSPSLLDFKAFEKPFDYKLNIQRGDVSPEPTTVDLQETFHYLIGMHVQQIELLDHQGRDYWISYGEISGPNGLETALVVWRELVPELDYKAEKAWADETLSVEDAEHVYVNGPSGIPDYQRIEYVFREKMDPAVGGGA